MATKDLYINDLLNRFSGYSFTESTTGSLSTVSFLDGSSTEVSAATARELIDAYRAIRLDILNGESPIFLSSTTERDALTNVDAGATIYNTDVDEDETYNGTSWVSAGGETGGIVHLAISTVQTTDNTQTSIGSFTLAEENAYLFTAEVIGETVDHAVVAGFILECTAKRITGGSAVIVGSITITHSGKDSSASSWGASFTVSGNDISVAVTGQNGTTVEWESSLNYLIF